MSDQLIQLDARRLPVRMVMILALGCAMLGSWYAVRWYIGNTMAQYLNSDDPTSNIARNAVALGPSDPLTHLSLAEFARGKLALNQSGLSLTEYEKATALSPADYRLWLTFGRALESEGDTQRAEKAMRRAVELAPSYSYPRWYFGNLLIREGRYPEAFAELRRASEGNPEFQPQLFSLAWQVYESDVEAMKQAVGADTEVEAKFANYLVKRGKVDDGLRVWNTLSEDQKRQNHESGEAIIETLVGNKSFHKTIDLWNDLSPGTSYRAAIGQIIDAGFEHDMPRGPGAVFGWQAQSLQQAQIAIDPSEGHSGGRSLRIVFEVRSKLTSLNISQRVPVQPNAEYDFECYEKTEKLESGGTPFVVITDAVLETGLGASSPAPNGNSDWHRIAFSFRTGSKTEAVMIRINRAPCGDSPVCPIFGKIWYDDFDLKLR